MDLQTYVTPENIGGAVAGLVFSGAALVGLIVNRRQVGVAIIRMSTRLFSQIGFFSLVIVVFMGISVLESGDFFNQNITHHAVFGFLGYALALGFDLVSIVCMVARLNAERMRDERGSRLNLVGVMICAAVSAFANACSSLQGYDPAHLNHTPLWMQSVAPWTGLVFPTMIVVLSMTSDHILDHAPARGVDVDTFRARERKRVDMLQVRLDTERDLLRLETEQSTLRRNREQASGRVPREWVFWRWLRPVAPAPVPSGPTRDEITQEIDQAVQRAHAALEARLNDLSTSMHQWNGEFGQHLSDLRLQLDSVQKPGQHRRAVSPKQPSARRAPVQGTQDAHPAHLSREEQGTPARSVDTQDWQEQDGNRDQGKTGEQGSAAMRIQAALQHLGTGASDARIAREASCSRKTVARWRKRFPQPDGPGPAESRPQLAEIPE
jgi:hypothetical protein